MSDPSKTYWQSLEQLSGESVDANEFAEYLPVGVAAIPPEQTPRRDFFKVMGLSAAAVLAACNRAPVQKIVPFTKTPENVTPGLALWYASTCGGCSAQCGTLVKARDGRPIKIEGNPEHPHSKGGVCAVGQASVLGLYDASRARHPSMAGSRAEWSAVDAAVLAGLQSSEKAGKGIRVVLPWRTGPTQEAAVRRFLSAHPGARTVRYDALGEIEGIAEAHRITHGARILPSYRIDRASVIVSFGADFLGTWLSPVGFTKQYREARNVDARREMAHHVQLEGQLSLTGSSADKRIPLRPSETIAVLGALVKELGGFHAVTLPEPKLERAMITELAARLRKAGKRGLVLSGSEDPAVQLLVNAANDALGNAGVTVVYEDGERLDADALTFGEFFSELEQGSVGAAFFVGVNPVQTHPNGKQLAAKLSGLELSVSTAEALDETAAAAKVHAPDHHALESWGDAYVDASTLAVRQPVVRPLHQTRSVVESLLRWSRVEDDGHAFLRARWEKEVFPRAGTTVLPFQDFWDASVQRGVARVSASPPGSVAFDGSGIAAALRTRPTEGEWEVVLHSSLAIRDGAHANNGWLQELPDPLTKIAWGNAASIAPSRAEKLGLKNGDVVKLTSGGREVSLPVMVQPGTHPDVIAIPVGYGRAKTGAVGNGIGEDAYPLATVANGHVSLTRTVTVSATGETRPLAMTQTHASLEGRPHVREAEFSAFLENPRAGNEGHGAHGGGHPLSIWSGHKYEGHRWAMAIDLSACTGCGACVVSCNAENNIPIVGRDEVARRRELHWLRIDRYFAGDPDNPEVVHQPMLCQHCENAPCETVCPVVATVHSSEGLNQQVYNRCVGTRYCANNCPTKTRRFNWFNYDRGDALERMVLNPDVAVRSRGVMEKCSFCVQRIEEGKSSAKRENRPLLDGQILTACQQSCPANAIHFGDINDANSGISKFAKSGRAYKLLDELNIGASISYLTRIRNRGEGTPS